MFHKGKRSVMRFVLGDNSAVGPDIVARDVLGLIRQDVKGRQATLLKEVLELLYYVSKNSSINELSGSYMPVQMMPIFFQLTVRPYSKLSLFYES